MESVGAAQDSAHPVYRDALTVLREAGVPALIGGAFAFESYTGIVRQTKDLDLFVRPRDSERLLRTLAQAGYRTELRFPHWLGKAWKEDASIDVIFSSGNGLCTVDDGWFTHAPPAVVLGLDVALTPAEETIWSKAFVMERNRYDGGDIAHLLRARARWLDWPRLLSRFNRHWRVLFSHVVLFGFIYPDQRLRVPDWFMREMLRRMEQDMLSLPADRRVCQGTLLSWSQYLVHIERGEYEDARLAPRGSLNPDDTAHVTAVLGREQAEGDPQKNGAGDGRDAREAEPHYDPGEAHAA
ncbi:nucleotidyltransferase domain-containing protein [Nitrospira moscoviensis]|uniref:Nucleotidyltransferase family protein n=1 Tax=Nitrospira moscoviensis TaxID=42253 RepID=A0A0K2GDT9_NITMO|nr:hypothetical protein [Nitrospira moscoviensis]ALA59019.1 hypothetical protein NITMOv2_2606 [Nitrospira moscoviensis]